MHARFLMTWALVVLTYPPVFAATSSQYTIALGQPLADALRALQQSDLQFLFSDELVSPDLRVRSVPSSRDPIQQAHELLAPHGLKLREVEKGLYAIVTAGLVAESQPGSPPLREDETITLSEVQVTASRYRIDRLDAPLALDAFDVANNPAPGDDPLRAIARLPGIASDGLSARTHIRGGDTDEVLLLLDGYPLRNAFHLSGYQSPFSVIDAHLVESIDVYSGGFPARFGNRMSGVFDIRTRAATLEPRHAVGVDFYNVVGSTSGQLTASDSEYLVSGRIGTLSPILGAFAPSVGDPRYADAFMRLETTLSDAVQLRGHLLWARDALGIAERRSGERATLEDQSRYGWVTLGYQPTTRWRWTTVLGQTQINNRRVGSVDQQDVVQGRLRDLRSTSIWDLHSAVEIKTGQSGRFEAGAEFTHEAVRYDYAAEAVYAPAVAALFSRMANQNIAVDDRLSGRRVGLFVAQDWQPLMRLNAEMGLRAQQLQATEANKTWRLEPRLAMSWAVSPVTRLHMSWGRFHQQDEIHELRIEQGLTNTPAMQRSEHFILGLRHAPLVHWNWRVELFSKRQSSPRLRFENLFNRRTVLPEIAADRVEVQSDFAELRGLELSAQWSKDAWQLWSVASWSEALDESQNEHTRRSWDATTSFGAGLKWSYGPWSANAALQLRRGFPTTGLVQTLAGVRLAERNSSRFGVFRQLDLRLQYEQDTARGRVQYYFELVNATNHPNTCCTILDASSGTLTLRSQQGMPVFPSFGLLWVW